MSPQYFKQEKRVFGLWEAVKRFVSRRHVLPMIGYLILAVAIAFAITKEHTFSSELKTNTRTVLIEGCRRNNEFRGIVRDILVQSEANIQAQAKKGLIPPDEATNAERQTLSYIAEVQNLDCYRLYKGT